MKRKSDRVFEEEPSKDQKVVDLGYFNRIGVDITKWIIRLMIENNYDEKYKIPHICRTFKEYYILDEEFRLDYFFEHNWPYALSLVFYAMGEHAEIGFSTYGGRSSISIAYNGSGYEFRCDGQDWPLEILDFDYDDFAYGHSYMITGNAVERKLKPIARIATRISIEWDSTDSESDEKDEDDELGFIRVCSRKYCGTFDQFKKLLFPKYRDFMTEQLKWLVRMNALDDSKPANRYF